MYVLQFEITKHCCFIRSRLSQAPHPNTQSHGLIEGLRVLDSSEFTQLFPPSMSNELVKQKIKLWMKVSYCHMKLIA